MGFCSGNQTQGTANKNQWVDPLAPMPAVVIHRLGRRRYARKFSITSAGHFHR